MNSRLEIRTYQPRRVQLAAAPRGWPARVECGLRLNRVTQASHETSRPFRFSALRTASYFTASDDPAPCVYTNGKHVRVAVGVVVVAPEDVRLVYLDPIWDEVEVKVLRKHHLLRAPAFELLTA